MNQKTFKHIVGNYKITNAIRDTDGDKVVDILDCEPNNPNKQGWIHDKIKNWNKERAESKAQESEFKRQAQEAGEQKYAEERVKYLKEKSEKAAVARARSPSLGESVGSVVRGFATGISKPAVRASSQKRRKVVTYVKKGKHYVKRTKYVGAPRAVNTADRNRDGMPDIFGMRSDRNRDGKIDVLGMNRKKGNSKQPSIFNMRFY